jgi:hypothetical protein
LATPRPYRRPVSQDPSPVNMRLLGTCPNSSTTGAKSNALNVSADPLNPLFFKESDESGAKHVKGRLDSKPRSEMLFPGEEKLLPSRGSIPLFRPTNVFIGIDLSLVFRRAVHPSAKPLPGQVSRAGYNAPPARMRRCTSGIASLAGRGGGSGGLRPHLLTSKAPVLQEKPGLQARVALSVQADCWTACQ